MGISWTGDSGTGHPCVVSPQQTLARSDTALVSGTVTNADTAPLPNITVSATRVESISATETISYESTVTTTAPNGMYLLTLEPGDYYFTYTDSTGMYLYAETEIITLATGEILTGQHVILRRIPLLSGTLTDGQGHALSDIMVAALSYEESSQTWKAIAETYSDEDGLYRLVDLPAGTYRLSYVDESGTFTTRYWADADTIETADDIIFDGDTPHYNLDMVLQPSADCECEKFIVLVAVIHIL